jgi:hypothetical protein
LCEEEKLSVFSLFLSRDMNTNKPPPPIHVSAELYRQLIHDDTLRRRREGGFSFMMQGASHSSSSLPIHHHAAISQTVVWKMYHSESQGPRIKVISGFPTLRQTNSTFHNICIISSASGLARTGFESCSGTILYDVVCFLLRNSPASDFYMPTFRNTLSPSS